MTDKEEYELAYARYMEAKAEAKRKNLRDRWTDWQLANAGDVATEDELKSESKSFAVRGDGELVLFDDQGYFLIKGYGLGEDPTEKGHMVPNVYRLVSADETVVADAYIEPVDVWGIYEVVQGVMGL